MPLPKDSARRTRTKKAKGSVELRSVVNRQHRVLLDLIDRAESASTLRVLTELQRAMSTQLDLEAEILHPKESSSEHALYARESHAILRIALDRACNSDANQRQRQARLRVLRDLFVRHAEREELVTMEWFESELGSRAMLGLARRLACHPASSAALRKGK